MQGSRRKAGTSPSAGCPIIMEDTALYQRFSRPDRYFGRCGHLDAAVTESVINGAPPFLCGLRALFLSDVHVTDGTTRADLAALAERIASLRPHLLLMGGDYADRSGNAVRFFEALAPLKPPLGCFGVLGNNDAEAWMNRLDVLRSVMADSGCALLVNESVEIPHNGGTLCVGGTDEYLYGAPDTRALWPKQASPRRYRILLSHYPVLPASRPELMLCGHTHGGQFNLLGLTPYAIGFERFVRPRRAPVAIAGLHDIDDMQLLISKGVGASRVQLRVGVQPEINLLTFE